ncbi:phage tail tape measure protein [Stagnimonas aquatica]|uniref:Phage tail tape measure protein n=1 Tax=Stagnimonas aquatica TaxID=2689987 RepID=A0A3N0V787_9GAMM|nr:phage tail tape measure protein [Stagnimonas aquatica]ROH88666.1 phage tail tape measure protein [Stagnimonas aquatica]
MTEMTVALRLLLEGRQFDSGFGQAGRTRDRFVRDTRRDFSSINRLLRETRNQLATIGVGFGGYQIARQSAQLDKGLIQLRQTAGATREASRSLRADLFAMSRETGQSLDALKGGMDALVQSGLTWAQAVATIRAVNPASAITGAAPDVLSRSLVVASNSYNLDLAQPGLATKLLEQMTVAGRLGNAELENLASIFPRVGVNARKANLEFAQTLAYVEALSQVEMNPERLATLAESTLRLFTNESYKKAAQKATGVPFYTPAGAARNPLDTLNDISKAYQQLTTDQARNRYIDRAFGKTDLDTQRGIAMLLSSDSLTKVRTMTEQVRESAGIFEHDLPEALDNAVDQAGRMKSVMREVGDALAQPINKAFADLVSWQLNPNSKGGLDLKPTTVAAVTVAEVLALGALATGAQSVLGKLPGVVGKMLGGSVSTAAGVAQGQLIEKAGLGTAVFVTNWPASLGGGQGGAGETAAAAAGGAAAARAGGGLTAAMIGNAALWTAGLLAAGAGGWEIGSAIYRATDETEFMNNLGGAIALALSRFGNVEAYNAVERELNGRIEIQIDETGRARVGAITASGGLDLNVATGMTVFGSPP